MMIPEWFNPKRGEPYHWTHVLGPPGDAVPVTFSAIPTELAPHWCTKCRLAHSVEFCPYEMEPS